MGIFAVVTKRQLALFVFLVIGLMFYSQVQAKVPGLRIIPKYLPKQIRIPLQQRATELQGKLGQLTVTDTAIKERCVNLIKGSSEDVGCEEKQGALDKGTEEYVKEADEFNESVVAAVETYLGEFVVTHYRELQQLYNSCKLLEIEYFEPLSQTEKINLEYFIREVAPKLETLNDALAVAWWAKIERVFAKKGGPWTFTNCGGKEKDVLTLDCTVQLQVGYGVQVKDNLVRLREAFRHFYPGKLPRDIGQEVLRKAGITDLKFPDADWRILTNPNRIENIRGSGKSNYFWAATLMRDPLIGAYLEAKIMKENFNCYWPDRPHAHWCNYYARNRKGQSAELLAMLKAWQDIIKK